MRLYWKKYNLNDAERSTEKISDVDKISETYGKETQTSEASTERSSLKKPPKILIISNISGFIVVRRGIEPLLPG